MPTMRALVPATSRLCCTWFSRYSSLTTTAQSIGFRTENRFHTDFHVGGGDAIFVTRVNAPFHGMVTPDAGEINLCSARTENNINPFKAMSVFSFASA